MAMKQISNDEHVKSMVVDTHYHTLTIETDTGKKFVVEVEPSE